MAKELNFAHGSSGLTMTAQLYANGVASGSAIDLAEVSLPGSPTEGSGIYSGDMAGAAGVYVVSFLSSGVLVGSGEIAWNGSAEITLASTLNADVKKVNGVTIVGDGSGTPFNV